MTAILMVVSEVAKVLSLALTGRIANPYNLDRNSLLILMDK